MINVLLIDKNLSYSKKIVNYITIRNKNIRFSGIATNIEDIKEVIDNVPIDIIILDLNSFSYEKIKNIICIKRLENAIICIGNKENINIEFLKYTYDYISKDVNEILKSINKLTINKIEVQTNTNKLNENIIKEKIKEELKFLRYNFSHIGVDYLIESIYIIYSLENYSDFDYNLKRDIYPVVAKKFKKSINNVKCNIVNATNIMFCECEEEKLMKYLGYSEIIKPGPKIIISTILNKIYRMKVG